MANRPMNAKSNSALITTLLVVTLIGAINWGLVGFFNFNVVDAIFGGGAREQTSALSRVIYSLVGIAALILAFRLPPLLRDFRRSAT